MADSDFIPFDRLLDWIEGRLPAEEAAQLEAALVDAGPQAQGEVAWLRAFGQARSSLELDTPSPDLHAALLRQYQPPLARRIAERVAALLSFDSAMAQPAMAGLRSGELRARQLVFSCDLLEVALNMRPSRHGDRLDVNGQIFPRELPDPEGLLARLSRGGELVDVSLTNDLGEFQFVSLTPGDYTLDLVGDAGEVAVETFALRLGPPH
jgi:hypothetical protein